jgi:glycosyltransferase involved in cell wall biosynthesis
MALRVAYVSDERFPSAHTDCQQVVKTADALGAEGCAVDLIVPRTAAHAFLSPASVMVEVCAYFNVDGGFRLRELRGWPASGLRLEKLTHGVAGAIWGRLGRYDYVHTRNVLPAALASALGVPVLFETYRALPESNPWAWRVLRRAMARPGFVGIAAHSDLARAALVAGGADAERVVVVHNGFDPADFAPRADRRAARRGLNIPDDARVAVYAGHVRPDKGTSTLLDLAEDCPSWRVVLLGGAARDVRRLRREAEARGLHNVVTAGHVPVADVPAALAAADVLLLPFASAAMAGSRRSTVLPMKVFSYLAAGRPILAPELPDTRGVLVHGENCFKVDPDDRELAADALELIGSSPALADRLAAGAALSARGYTWRARARRIVEFVSSRLAA